MILVPIALIIIGLYLWYWGRKKKEQLAAKLAAQNRPYVWKPEDYEAWVDDSEKLLNDIERRRNPQSNVIPFKRKR